MHLSFAVRPAVAALVLACSGVAFAQSAPPSRIRGDIVSVSADSLVVHRTGPGATDAHIAFGPDVPVGAVKNVKLADVKPGDYVGAATLPDANGKLVAKEVLVFPEAMRGSSEGHYDWDLLPGSSMTNANVDTVVQANDGRELKLSYKGGSKTITVPADAPVVTFTGAARADVVAGRKVFVIAKSSGPGQYAAQRVIVEKDGVAPPM